MATSTMRVAPDDPERAWSDSGVFEVAPGVHRIPLPLPNDGLRGVNAYALDTGDGGLTLVDAGQILTGAEELITAALAALDRSPADVRRCLVTHAHRDHYTQAVAMRRTWGTRVALGDGERASVAFARKPGKPMETHLRVLDRCGAGALRGVLERLVDGRDGMPVDIWEEPDDWLADGQEIALGDGAVRAVATPGHTTGHLVYHDEARARLYAGDHVLPHITPSIGFEAVRTEYPLRDYLASLRLVRARPDARLLPAHGHVTDSVHARVDALLDHHDARLAATEKAVHEGRATGLAAAEALTWTRRDRRLDELDPFNQMLAVMETAAHLDLLVLQDRLTRTDVDGVGHYS